MHKQQNRVPIKAIAISFEIIRALRDLDGAGVSELAEHLDMPKSTIHDHLQTLTRMEYLVNRDGTYQVAARFLELGGYARNQLKLFRVAEPEVEKLAHQTGEHANLMIEEHGKGIFLYKATGEDAVQLDTYSGMRVHLHTTALGKAILSQFPEETVDEIIDRHGIPGVTPETITDPDELKDELAEVADRGYAIDDEERVEGMRCVAAPICDSNGYPLGATSISGPVSRFEGKLFQEEVPKRVLSTANVIEVNMTYS